MSKLLQSLTRFGLAALIAAAPWACGADSGDSEDGEPAGVVSQAQCAGMCNEAQLGDCTSVKGECGAFCDALFSVEEDAGCTTQRRAYHDCLSSNTNVCAASCDGEESTLTDCVAVFCVPNASRSDCGTLMASF